MCLAVASSAVFSGMSNKSMIERELIYFFTIDERRVAASCKQLRKRLACGSVHVIKLVISASSLSAKV